MSCPSLTSHIFKTLCKDEPEQVAPYQSTTGAIIFFSYIVLALLLTGAIISFQVQAYRSLSSQIQLSSEASRQLTIRCLLAVISFTVLSYHMLFFLVDSYSDWVSLHKKDVPNDLAANIFWHIQHIWEWATHTQLFKRFSKDVFAVKDADGWIFLALAWELMIAMKMTVVGRERNMPYVWCYTFLGQILPISFIQNLFGIATFLDDLSQTPGSGAEHKDTPQKRDAQKAWWQEYLEIILSTAIPMCYGIVVGCLPLLRGTNLLMPGVLLTRAFLLLPTLMSRVGLAPRSLSSKLSRISTFLLIFSGSYPYLRMNKGQVQCLQDNLVSSPQVVLRSLFSSHKALQANHAIAALGWDIVIGVASSILYTII